jgi:hypothetical protein
MGPIVPFLSDSPDQLEATVRQAPRPGHSWHRTAAGVKYPWREMRRTTGTTADRGAGGSGDEVTHAAGATSGVPGGRSGTSEPESGRKPETYRSALALLIWWLWLAFAAANLIDLAVQGHDRLSAVAAAVLLLVTGIAYAAALRPRVIASGEGIVVRNPLRDHKVPWPAVAKVDLGDLLRVHCAWEETAGQEGQRRRQPVSPPAGVRRSRVIHAWAIQSSRRARTGADLQSGLRRTELARRSVSGPAGVPEPPGAVHRRETEQIAQTLDERARNERARRAAPAPETGQGDPRWKQETGREAAASPEGPHGPVTAWHWPSVAALLLPALLLIIVVFA